MNILSRTLVQRNGTPIEICRSIMTCFRCCEDFWNLSSNAEHAFWLTKGCSTALHTKNHELEVGSESRLIISTVVPTQPATLVAPSYIANTTIPCSVSKAMEPPRKPTVTEDK